MPGVVVGADEDGSLATGAGESLERVGWLSSGIGGRGGWGVEGDGKWVEAADCTWVEARGCIRIKAKQNTDMTSSGGPISNRWELIIWPELLDG
jgi:hypothetical protein